MSVQAIKKAVPDAALSAAEPVAWLVKRYDLDGILLDTELSFVRPTIRSTCITDMEPLYAATPAPSGAVNDILAELDNVFSNDEQDRETLAKIRTMVSALSAQVQNVAGWSYDLKAAPTGLMEFAFTNSLGFTNVRICERMGHHTDSGIRYFYREDGQEVDLNSNGWRAYAWREVLAPAVYPAAPAKPEGSHVTSK